MRVMAGYCFVMLPPTLLGKWTLFISAVSLFNSAQTYVGDLSLSQRIYNEKPSEVTALSNRTFGTWTALVGIIRFLCAWNLDDPLVWKIAFTTYAMAGIHFTSEWLVFKTARLGAGLYGPLVVAFGTMTWMLWK